MKITVSILGWTDICCGCKREIKPTKKVYMLSGLTRDGCSIHLCENCIDIISNSKDMELIDDSIFGLNNDYKKLTPEDKEKAKAFLKFLHLKNK